MSGFEALPPSMGFPEEHWEASKFHVAFYTCVVGKWRIFVFCRGDDERTGWGIERIVNDKGIYASKQFFGRVHHPGSRFIANLPHKDPVVLMAIIQHLTSEGNDADPTSAIQSVLASHV